MKSIAQTMHLAQTLKLSPTLLQSMKILQMNTVELSEYLNAIAEENPVLLREEPFDQQSSWHELTDKLHWLFDVPNPKFNSSDEERPDYGISPTHVDSLSLFLNDQLSRLKLPPQILALSKFLVDMLDERGYLNEDELEDLAQTGVPRSMLLKAINILQSLKPTGIAARNLSECLTLQLKRLPGDHTLSLAIAKLHLESLANRNYAWLAKNLGATISQILEAEAELKSLNPDPIWEFEASKPAVFIRPDAWIGVLEGKIRVFLNHWDLPQFRMSEEYLQMQTHTQDQDLKLYLRQKNQQAQWLLHCVARRHNTLETCLLAIAAWQNDYFSCDGSLRPMTQYDIASQINIHPSTVSRAIRNKYLQCQQGLFPVSHFFFRKVGQGPEAPSEFMIKQHISQFICQEDKAAPFSDYMLTTLLQNNDIQVSRRTVAKYRSELGFRSSYQRKEN